MEKLLFWRKWDHSAKDEGTVLFDFTKGLSDTFHLELTFKYHRFPLSFEMPPKNLSPAPHF